MTATPPAAAAPPHAPLERRVCADRRARVLLRRPRAELARGSVRGAPVGATAGHSGPAPDARARRLRGESGPTPAVCDRTSKKERAREVGDEETTEQRAPHLGHVHVYAGSDAWRRTPTSVSQGPHGSPTPRPLVQQVLARTTTVGRPRRRRSVCRDTIVDILESLCNVVPTVAATRLRTRGSSELTAPCGTAANRRSPWPGRHRRPVARPRRCGRRSRPS